MLRRLSFYLLLLLLCGDVELNPGPGPTLQMIFDGQEAIKAQLQGIEANQLTQNLVLEDVKKRLSSLEAQVATLTNLESVVNECRKSCEDQQRITHSLMSKVDDLENRSRRCNLVFYGVADTNAQETWSVSETLVREICETKLGVKPTTIERAHRIGKFQADKTRPIIANFASFKEKQTILGNAKHLKGTRISLSEDFSDVVRRKRRHLWEFAKSRKTDDTRVRLRHDVLYLNDVKYVFDDDTSQVVQFK